jgi:hypothetical protein
MVSRAEGKIPKRILLQAADLVEKQCLQKRVAKDQAIRNWGYDRKKTKCFKEWDTIPASKQFDVVKYLHWWLSADPKPNKEQYVSVV